MIFFHGGEDVNGGLFCDALWNCTWIQMFRRNRNGQLLFYYGVFSKDGCSKEMGTTAVLVTKYHISKYRCTLRIMNWK
jgi:hypothetical protein